MNCSHSWNHWNIPGDENKDFLLLPFHPTEDTSANLVSTFWLHKSAIRGKEGLKTIRPEYRKSWFLKGPYY